MNSREASDKGKDHSTAGTQEFVAPAGPSPLLAARLSAVRGRSFNNAISFAMDMVRSESARVDGRLMDDFGTVMRGNCLYLEGFACAAGDLTLYDRLKAELVAHSGEALDANGLIAWSKHQIYENPVGVSVVFTELVAMMAEYFDVEVYATRLNYYRDGSQWKPYHHDSHAYGGKALREDFTMGLTLGATRALSFLHEPSKMTFAIPQKNGDMFAFTSEVNDRFQHGVPRTSESGDRFSIIAWGRRRAINERNGGAMDLAKRLGDANVPATLDDAVSAAHLLVSASRRAPPPEKEAPAPAAADADAKPATAKAKRPKNRLQ